MVGSVRKSGRGRYYARYISHYTRKNHIIIGLGLLFMAGVMAGAVFIGSSEGKTHELLSQMVSSFIESRKGQAFVEIFTSSAFSSLVFICALFMCGFCAVSQPLEIAAPFIKGFGFGISAACLYGGYGARAASYISVFMLPSTLISTIAILFCCREALRLSGSFLSCMRKTDNIPYPLKIYVARFFIASLLCIFSAFIESCLYSVFAKFVILR